MIKNKKTQFGKKFCNFLMQKHDFIDKVMIPQ